MYHVFMDTYRDDTPCHNVTGLYKGSAATIEDALNQYAGLDSFKCLDGEIVEGVTIMTENSTQQLTVFARTQLIVNHKESDPTWRYQIWGVVDNDGNVLREYQRHAEHLYTDKSGQSRWVSYVATPHDGPTIVKLVEKAG